MRWRVRIPGLVACGSFTSAAYLAEGGSVAAAFVTAGMLALLWMLCEALY